MYKYICKILEQEMNNDGELIVKKYASNVYLHDSENIPRGFSVFESNVELKYPRLTQDDNGNWLLTSCNKVHSFEDLTEIIKSCNTFEEFKNHFK